MSDYKMLAARAISYCPRDLAEALAAELGIPMPEGYFDPREVWGAHTTQRSWPYRDVSPASCACCGQPILRPHCSVCHEKFYKDPADR